MKQRLKDWWYEHWADCALIGFFAFYIVCIIVSCLQ